MRGASDNLPTNWTNFLFLFCSFAFASASACMSASIHCPCDKMCTKSEKLTLNWIKQMTHRIMERTKNNFLPDEIIAIFFAPVHAEMTINSPLRDIWSYIFFVLDFWYSSSWSRRAFACTLGLSWAPANSILTFCLSVYTFRLLCRVLETKRWSVGWLHLPLPKIYKL